MIYLQTIITFFLKVSEKKSFYFQSIDKLTIHKTLNVYGSPLKNKFVKHCVSGKNINKYFYFKTIRESSICLISVSNSVSDGATNISNISYNIESLLYD